MYIYICIYKYIHTYVRTYIFFFLFLIEKISFFHFLLPHVNRHSQTDCAAILYVRFRCTCARTSRMTRRRTTTFHAVSSASPSVRATSCTSSTRMILTGGRRTARARTIRRLPVSFRASRSRNCELRFTFAMSLSVWKLFHDHPPHRMCLNAISAHPSYGVW